MTPPWTPDELPEIEFYEPTIIEEGRRWLYLLDPAGVNPRVGPRVHVVWNYDREPGWNGNVTIELVRGSAATDRQPGTPAFQRYDQQVKTDFCMATVKREVIRLMDRAAGEEWY